MANVEGLAFHLEHSCGPKTSTSSKKMNIDPTTPAVNEQSKMLPNMKKNLMLAKRRMIEAEIVVIAAAKIDGLIDCNAYFVRECRPASPGALQ